MKHTRSMKMCIKNNCTASELGRQCINAKLKEYRRYIMKVIYPVCIFQTKDEYMAFVPDLNTNNTYGKTLEETLYMAQDLIATYILEDLEDVKKNEIPKQSKMEDIDIKEVQKYWEIEDKEIISSFKTLVIVDLDEFAQKWSNKSI